MVAPPALVVSAGSAPPPALVVYAIKKRFGGVHVLRGVSLEVAERSITGLIGPNGSGKSTLFDVITGYQRADAGRVTYRGVDLIRVPPHQIARRGLSRTFQLTRIFPNLTVLENMLVCSTSGLNAGAVERATELLASVHLESFAAREASGLSYGQQKLLELAQVLMLDPQMVLLDEPMAGVNPALIDQISQHVLSLREMGKTFLVVEHNVPVVAALCDQLVVISAGQVIAHGAPAEVLADANVAEAYLGT